MKLSTRLTGADAPAKLARRLEADLETARTPRLEGRFKDHRDISGRRGPGASEGIGDLRTRPRPEPRKYR